VLIGAVLGDGLVEGATGAGLMGVKLGDGLIGAATGAGLIAATLGDAGSLLRRISFSNSSIDLGLVTDIMPLRDC
jgi:hypothetical protein